MSLRCRNHCCKSSDCFKWCIWQWSQRFWIVVYKTKSHLRTHNRTCQFVIEDVTLLPCVQKLSATAKHFSNPGMVHMIFLLTGGRKKLKWKQDPCNLEIWQLFLRKQDCYKFTVSGFVTPKITQSGWLYKLKSICLPHGRGFEKEKKAGSFWIRFIPSFCEMLVNIFPPSCDFSFLFFFMQLTLVCLQKIPKRYKEEILSLEHHTGKFTVSVSNTGAGGWLSYATFNAFNDYINYTLLFLNPILSYNNLAPWFATLSVNLLLLCKTTILNVYFNIIHIHSTCEDIIYEL